MGKSLHVVPYIGTWIETEVYWTGLAQPVVVPYIGTWIETLSDEDIDTIFKSYLI